LPWVICAGPGGVAPPRGPTPAATPSWSTRGNPGLAVPGRLPCTQTHRRRGTYSRHESRPNSGELLCAQQNADPPTSCPHTGTTQWALLTAVSSGLGIRTVKGPLSGTGSHIDPLWQPWGDLVTSGRLTVSLLLKFWVNRLGSHLGISQCGPILRC
jgi:hypothetical protein